MLKWLSLDLIKAHLRIDPVNGCEDALLTFYGESAEATVLNHLNRTFEDLVQTYGEVPTPVIQGSLLMVDTSYQHRSPVSPNNMSIVPYTFDILVKPYMKLTR